jgi:putative ABC transport system substrate-binding protein
LAQVIPPGGAIGFLTNVKSVQSGVHAKDFQTAAAGIRRETIIVKAGNDSEIESAFDVLTQKRVAGLVVENDPFFDSRRRRLIALTAQRRIPAIYHIREFPAEGGLMSYGANLVDAYNQMGVLAGRVLKGASVTDLPVIRPTRFELSINLGTAKALGITIPPTVLAIADEIAE